MIAGCLMSAATAPASAQPIRYFDEPLSPYGTWVDDPTYGRVWRPRDTPADWRPYTYGRWVYTSEYGWVWVSEEPWGWVVYHYGHWVWTSQYGWVWVAGDVWGPSWVEWCYGGGYVGWTPMPPDPYWQGGTYYGVYDCSSPRYYSRAVFVSETYFASPRISAHVVAPSQNAVAARGTVNVTSYARANGLIANRSIDIVKLQAATGQSIKPIRVVQAKGPVPVDASRGVLQELRIYRPTVAAIGEPRLDLGRAPKLDLEPDLKSVPLTPAPLDTGAVRAPSLGKPVESPSLPSLGNSGIPSLGGGDLGGGVLGGVRGRLGR
jgi:hypothetical protein